MTSMTTPTGTATQDVAATASAPRGADDWQRRFGVPWDRIDRAARAVLDRAAAASKRKFADLGAPVPVAEARPG